MSLIWVGYQVLGLDLGRIKCGFENPHIYHVRIFEILNLRSIMLELFLKVVLELLWSPWVVL